MRASHQDQIERWAEFVRNNPATWKKIHTPFINAIFAKHKEFLERLRKTPHGEEKIKEMFGLQ